MAYEQIDGNKNILVNERGQLREGLRNIEPDYEYDKDGNIDTDKWPTVVVQSSTGGEDRRLLPAEVLKIHGELPANGHYTRNMFDAEDGDKTNCSKDNIIFNQETPKQPYKSSPEEETEEDKGEEDQPTGKVVNDPTKTGQPDPEEKEQMKEGEGGSSEEEDESNSSGNKIVGQSQDYNATPAVEIIKNNSLEDLLEADFYNEDSGPKEKRVTVEEAWNKKKEAGKQKQTESE